MICTGCKESLEVYEVRLGFCNKCVEAAYRVKVKPSEIMGGLKMLIDPRMNKEELEEFPKLNRKQRRGLNE